MRLPRMARASCNIFYGKAWKDIKQVTCACLATSVVTQFGGRPPLSAGLNRCQAKSTKDNKTSLFPYRYFVLWLFSTSSPDSRFIWRHYKVTHEFCHKQPYKISKFPKLILRQWNFIEIAMSGLDKILGILASNTFLKTSSCNLNRVSTTSPDTHFTFFLVQLT